MITLSRQSLTAEMLLSECYQVKLDFLQRHLGKNLSDLPLFYLIELIDQMKVHLKVIHE